MPRRSRKFVRSRKHLKRGVGTPLKNSKKGSRRSGKKRSPVYRAAQATREILDTNPLGKYYKKLGFELYTLVTQSVDMGNGK